MKRRDVDPQGAAARCPGRVLPTVAGLRSQQTLPFVPGQPTHVPRPRLPAAAWVTVQPPRPPAQDATPAKGNLGLARTSTFQAHSMPVSIDESPGKRRPSMLSFGTPQPAVYMTPRLNCASASPAFAEGITIRRTSPQFSSCWVAPFTDSVATNVATDTANTVSRIRLISSPFWNFRHVLGHALYAFAGTADVTGYRSENRHLLQLPAQPLHRYGLVAYLPGAGLGPDPEPVGAAPLRPILGRQSRTGHLRRLAGCR